PVIDADVIAHQLVEPGQPALEQIITTFGMELRQRDGTLDRDKLRQLVFNNPTQRQRLEAILHPLVIKKLWAEAHSSLFPIAY
ncbi:MAG: dephospho-CoA kinase, partial [Thiotrichaceae bacterium IS1]